MHLIVESDLFSVLIQTKFPKKKLKFFKSSKFSIINFK